MSSVLDQPQIPTKQRLTLTDQHSYQAAYWEAGQGFPIIWLHGFMGQGDCWRSLVSQLPGYRCICLDMLGFGDSSKPMIRYDIATLVEFVHQFITDLAIGPCAIGGHSLGGWVAAAYAIAHPQTVQSLILVAPAGIRDDSFCGRYDWLRPILWPTPLIDGVLWGAQPLATLLGQRALLDRIRWMRRELNAQPAPRSFLLDRLRPEDAIDTVETVIHQIHTPTLVIAGECDETIPLWHCQTYARDIPQAQLVILPQADHALPQRYAQDLASAILPFLAMPGHSQ